MKSGLKPVNIQHENVSRMILAKLIRTSTCTSHQCQIRTAWKTLRTMALSATLNIACHRSKNKSKALSSVQSLPGSFCLPHFFCTVFHFMRILKALRIVLYIILLKWNNSVSETMAINSTKGSVYMYICTYLHHLWIKWITKYFT